MSQIMTRTQIYIESDVLAQAKLKAQSDGFNLSQYLRKLLKEDINSGISQPNMKNKTIKTFTISNLEEGQKVNYSNEHNDIYDI